jgi:excisionase family DNA binding protein
MIEKLSYSIPEAVQITGICRSRLYQEIGQGRLRMIKCGRRSAILADDLRQWLHTLPEAKHCHAA